MTGAVIFRSVVTVPSDEMTLTGYEELLRLLNEYGSASPGKEGEDWRRRVVVYDWLPPEPGAEDVPPFVVAAARHVYAQAYVPGPEGEQPLADEALRIAILAARLAESQWDDVTHRMHALGVREWTAPEVVESAPAASS